MRAWLAILSMAVGCWVVLSGSQDTAIARIHREGFDSDTPSWNARYSKSRISRLEQRRNRFIYHSGKASEQFQFDVSSSDAVIQCEHRIPPSRVLDDLKGSVWFRSQRNGFQLSLRVVFPRQKDPRTGAVLSALVRGDIYQSAPKWQRLNATVLEKQFAERLRRLRNQYHPTVIDARDPYVASVVIDSPELKSGTVEFFIDDLYVEGVISPSEKTPIIQVDGTDNIKSPIRFRLDRLEMDGSPTIPRITPFHGEDLDRLKDMHCNFVWVPNANDDELIRQLSQRKLYVMARPPRSPANDKGENRNASLVPFGQRHSQIVAWYMGTWIPPEARRELVAWASQVRAADRRLRRPLMGDVAGSETIFSRHLDMTGISRQMLNTDFSFSQYRDWFAQKAKLARPGSFRWTWIQTEPTPEDTAWRRWAEKTPIVIEPEQIRMQVYAALAAGYRGIGYWKTGPLDADSPADRERALAITQVNLEIELLQPLLATGTAEDQIPIELESLIEAARRKERADRLAKQAKDPLSFSLSRTDHSKKARAVARSLGLEAAVLQTEYGRLLLPMWLQRDSQFVPGTMLAKRASIVVPGVGTTASAWLITTTKIRNLRGEHVAGGLRITLDRLDQTAAIVITGDREFIGWMRKKQQRLQQQSATVCVELARSKFQRVQQVHQQLTELGYRQANGPQLMSGAATALKNADTALRRAQVRGSESNIAPQTIGLHVERDFDEARRWSEVCMQSLRLLQRLHWETAISQLSSPTSSLYTVSFQTLPDHHRLITRVGRTSLENENLLESGDFENIDVNRMISEGWQHEQTPPNGIRATAELALVPERRNYCMRLLAAPTSAKSDGIGAPRFVDKTLVSVTTPPIPIARGQIVFARGLIRVTSPIAASLEGVTVSDNLAGDRGALRWTRPRDWHQFNLIREVFQDGEFRLKLALNGLGEVHFDDLEISVLTPETPSKPEPVPESAERPRTGSLDFLQRFPRFNPLQPRN
ncbi:MAG: hypothetical protein CMJ78_12165 [Planctomycetaceae bacterium]|nr:hypothetical protein [Planctomycetaceae bacterium]